MMKSKAINQMEERNQTKSEEMQTYIIREELLQGGKVWKKQF
jgi:hypothetical protein